MKKVERPRVEDIHTGEQFKIVDIGNFEVNHALNEPSVVDFRIFDTDRNKFAFPMLKEYNFIIYKNEYYLTYLHGEDSSNTKDGVAIHVSSVLKKKRVHDEFTGFYHLNNVLNIAFDGSGFTFINFSKKNMKLQFENFGKDDRLSMLQHILKRFDVECYFSKYTVYIFDKVGTESDYQFRFGYNIKALDKKVDVTDCTFAVLVKGHKPTEEEGGGEQFIYYYESPLKYKMPELIRDWEAAVIEDDKIKHVETAHKRAVEAVQDTPAVSITVAHEELPNEKQRVPVIGDRALARHPKMKLDFDLRIIKIREYPYDNRSNAYEFSDKKEDVIDRNAGKDEGKFDLDLLMKQIKEINEKIVNFVTAATLDGKFDDAEKEQYAKLLNTKNELETKAQDLANGALFSANSYTDVAKKNAIEIAKAEAQQKAKEAQEAANAYAKSQAELAQKDAAAHADGVVTASEKAILDQAEQKVVVAKKYAEQKAQEAQVAAEKSSALDATNKADKAKADAIAAAKAEADRLAKEAQAAAQAYAKSLSELAEKQSKAYADGVITDSEKVVLAEAEKKVSDAKKYAEQKAKEAETAANNATNIKIDELKFLNRNRLRNTSAFRDTSFWVLGMGPGQNGNFRIIDSPIYGKVLQATADNGAETWWVLQNHFYTYDKQKFVAGKEYTLSFKYKSTLTVYVNFVDSNGQNFVTDNKVIPKSTEWTTFVYTFKARNTGVNPVLYLARPNGSDTGSIEITEVQLEEGNKQSVYSPAPEDIQADIDKAKELADQKSKEAQTAAQTYAEQKAAYEREQAKAYADGKVTTSEAKTLADAKSKLDEAKRHAETKATEAKNAAVAAAQADAQAKAAAAKQAAIAEASAESKLAEARTKAYADNVITAEESARLKGLENTLAAAKQDAQAKAIAAQKAATDAAALDASNKATKAESNAKGYTDNVAVPKKKIIFELNNSTETILLEAKRINLRGAVTAESIAGKLLEGITLRATDPNDKNKKAEMTSSGKIFSEWITTPDPANWNTARFETGLQGGALYAKTFDSNGKEKYAAEINAIGALFSMGNDNAGYGASGFSVNDNGQRKSISARAYVEHLDWKPAIQIDQPKNNWHTSITSTGIEWIGRKYRVEGWSNGIFFFKNNIALARFDTGNSEEDIDLSLNYITLRSGKWGDYYLQVMANNATRHTGIIASEFRNSSQRKIKTGIKDLQFSPLDIVMKAEVKEYFYKADMQNLYEMRVNRKENETLPTTNDIEVHYGVIADDAPIQLTNKDRTGVDVYGMASVNMAGLKEHVIKTNARFNKIEKVINSENNSKRRNVCKSGRRTTKRNHTREKHLSGPSNRIRSRKS